MKKLFFIIPLMLILVTPSAFAQVSGASNVLSASVPAETRELIRTLLEANGMRANMIRTFEEIISQAPAESQADLRAVLKGDAIIEQIIPVYAKHFSPVELKELINFYKSPVGSKNLQLTPVLMNEVMIVSQKYFEDSVKKIPKPTK